MFKRTLAAKSSQPFVSMPFILNDTAGDIWDHLKDIASDMYALF